MVKFGILVLVLEIRIVGFRRLGLEFRVKGINFWVTSFLQLKFRHLTVAYGF